MPVPAPGWLCWVEDEAVLLGWDGSAWIVAGGGALPTDPAFNTVGVGGAFLPRLGEVASVSGGSITAGLLALRWPDLCFDENNRAVNFDEVFVLPLLRFSGKGIDIKAALYGLLPGCAAADSLVRAYDRHLFHGACLQDITDCPRFTFMATNLQTGSGWRFGKSYAADYRVGMISKPMIPLARVVAASSPSRRSCRRSL